MRRAKDWHQIYFPQYRFSRVSASFTHKKDFGAKFSSEKVLIRHLEISVGRATLSTKSAIPFNPACGHWKS